MTNRNSHSNSTVSSPSRQDGAQIIEQVLESAIKLEASDVHLTVDQPPYFRVNGSMTVAEGFEAISNDQLQQLIDQELTHLQQQTLKEKGAADGVLLAAAEQRFRYNVYRSDGRLSIALRHLQNEFIELPELGLSADLYQLCHQRDGLILVAGPTGSGKSTTLATLIHHINQNRSGHIITIEDPVEFTHTRIRSLIHQRQIGADTEGFYQALLDALRQDPDVILVGEIRDLPTIRTAITAAETGHLVFASVHASDCTSAIERLISVFPGDQQQNIQHLLSTTLRAVIAQHLLASEVVDSTLSNSKSNASPGLVERHLASEVLLVNQAVRNLISGGNFNQIRSVMETHASDGMYTLDKSLAQLVRSRKIKENSARVLARNPDMIRQLARAV